jgi:ribosomal protein S2
MLSESCCIEILVNFKKSLRILFKYHSKKKKILFVGLPTLLSFEINNFTRHVALSKYDNLPKGILNVYKYKDVIINVKNYLLKKKMNKKPDLIVLLDHVNANDIVKESYVAKIPLIVVNTHFDKKSFFYRNVYNVSLNQNAPQSFYDFFFVGLSFLFK